MYLSIHICIYTHIDVHTYMYIYKAEEDQCSILLSFFVLLVSSPDWMRTTHILEGNLLYSDY